MRNGMGVPAEGGEFSIFSFQFSIKKLQTLLPPLLLLLLLLFLPSQIHATTTIDFSSTKDFFKELKVGESVSGDLSTGAIPNPYDGKGQLLGYKFVLPPDVDHKKVELKVQSCSILIATFCFGTSFAEHIYVFNSQYKPIGEDFKHKSSLEWEKVKLPEGRTLFLLVGSDDASGTGQFLLSVNLKGNSSVF